MHAGAIIANNGFGHKSCCFAIRMCDVMYDIFEYLVPVCALDQAIKARANFALTCRGYFMMVYFDTDPHLFQSNTHGGADVM